MATSQLRRNQTCTDEHMHRRVGAPGKIHTYVRLCSEGKCTYPFGARLLKARLFKARSAPGNQPPLHGSQCQGLRGRRSAAGGLCFVRIMNLYSELCFAKLYDLGCNFWDREGRERKLHPNLYRLAFPCLLFQIPPCHAPGKP